ncbi:hypothetical protein C6A37_09360, partial [Desulfobacteraceae bacterium SEEP-SAG9]
SLVKRLKVGRYTQITIAGLGQIYWHKGEGKKCSEIGHELINYGKKHSNYRCLATGYICVGLAFNVNGELPLAINSFKKANDVSTDPFYSQWSRLYLGFCYLENKQLLEAEKSLAEVVNYSDNFDCGYLGIPARFVLGVTMIARERMSDGFNLLNKAYEETIQKKWYTLNTIQEHILGQMYLQIA